MTSSPLGLSKITINVSPRVKAAITALTERHDMSVTAVINRAVLLALRIDELSEKDQCLRITHEDGSRERIYFL